ncbi:MAG: tetratricopeptide repeat protein [Anaerolineae bacterium]|nr:tetratricopeptide repeat protein [Anaerolineae bacterium]
MSEHARTWRDLLEKRGQHAFVGRENLIEQFRLNCLDKIPRELMTVIQGIAGIGKSATISRLREIALEYDIFSAYIDSTAGAPVQEKEIFQVMCKIAEKFAANGTPLTQFSEKYDEYIAVLQQVKDDPNAPGRIFDVIGGVNDQDAWHKQTWLTYFEKTLTKNANALVNQPVRILTQAFVHDINTWALAKRILLCFDDWQDLELNTGLWLRELLLTGHISTRIWIILGTRESLHAEWSKFKPVMEINELTELHETEVMSYLAGQHITEKQRANDIFTFSNGLPIMVKLLSSAKSGIAGDLALSPLDRYFKWLDKDQRNTVLLSSIPRIIDAQVLDTLFKNAGEIWLEWLISNHLLVPRDTFWIYHPALHDKFLSWAKRDMYQACYSAHVALRAYYQRLETETDFVSSNELTKHICELEAIYHGLMIGESGAIRHAVLSFVTWVRQDYNFAGQLVRTWQQASQAQDNSNSVVEWAEIVGHLWQSLFAGNWQTAATVCESILKKEAVDAEIKHAIHELNTAIQARFPKRHIQPKQVAAQLEIEETQPGQNTLITVNRGIETTRQQGSKAHVEDGNAQQNLPQSDSLSEQNDRLQKYSQILLTEPDNLNALWHRGRLLMEQQHYQEAVEDYDLAIRIAAQDVSFICARANAHFRLKDYENALKGYDEAIRIDAKCIEAYINRGVTHATLHDYRRAIADYNQVISMEPGHSYALHRRGRAYAKLQQDTLALKDYHLALEMTPRDVSIYIDLGLLYTKQAQYEKAREAYRDAVALDPQNATAHYNAACTAALMNEVDFACRMLKTAIDLHPPYKLMAAKDSDFSTIRQTPAFQKIIGHI